jgi:hypothetical protein
VAVAVALPKQVKVAETLQELEAMEEMDHLQL